MLAKGATTETADIKERRTPSIQASSSGRFEIVKILIEKGANKKATEVYRQTPLLLAAGQGYFEVVKILLENGADTEAVDKIHRTPLLE